jgi:hypothetical protein
MFNDTPPKLQIGCNLHFIFYTIYIICEISQNFAFFTLNFKFLYKQTSDDDDRLDRNM